LTGEDHQFFVDESTGDLSIVEGVITTMCTVLIMIVVIFTDRARACDIAAVDSIKARITLAKAICADAII
jgi:hypothetical protein